MDRLTFQRGLEHKVERMIRIQELCVPGDRIVVAVSGGPDSVALLRCLVSLRDRWQWDVSIGHVNHGLRGAESEEDAEFVKNLGKKYGVTVECRSLFLNKQSVRADKRSLQEYARSLRYQALEEMVDERKATKLALGHTADDQAETVLMWMLRGCGTGGLGGIPPQRGPYVIRPLLDIQRSEILTYLQEGQEEFRCDSSNSQPVYLRNRIRHQLIPQLKTYSEGIIPVLTRQAHLLRDDHAFLEALTHEAMSRTCVYDSAGDRQFDRLALLREPIALRRRLIRQCLQEMSGHPHSPPCEIVERALDRLEHGRSGWELEYHGVRVAQEYDRILFSVYEEERKHPRAQTGYGEIPMTIPGEAEWSPTGQRIALSHQHLPVTEQGQSNKVFLDGDTFSPDVRVRSWAPGDTFCPKGLGGMQKKLQDFFSDIKLGRSQRHRVPLLVAPEGILWIGGFRADERFHISSKTTSVIVATIK